MNRLDPLRLPLCRRQIIEASAGTGKTWTLAALYVRCVLGHGRPNHDGLTPSQILVMTFTEAATAELRERIRARLHQAALWFEAQLNGQTPQDDPFFTALSQDIPKADWPIGVRRLHLASQAMDEAAIYTIHAWSRRMLSSFALMSRALFEQTHLDNPNALLQTLVRDHWRKWYYPLPAPWQPLVTQLVGANPDVLLEKVRSVWRTQDRQPVSTDSPAAHPHRPSPLATLQTFFQWQSKQLACENAARDAWHSDLPDRLMRARHERKIRAAGINDTHFASWVSQLTDWALHAQPLALDVLQRFTAEKLQSNGWQEASELPFFQKVSDWVEHAAQKPEGELPLIEHAAHELRLAYDQAKSDQSVFDFNDLLQRLHHALHQDSGALADAIRQQYPVAMIDEFQDTDPWQYQSLDRIYARDRVDDRHALVMIGDPKQAIYRFRGADLDTYLLARRTALADDPNACHTLGTNHRSTPRLVDAVNALFGSMKQPFRSQKDTIDFEPVDSASKALPLNDASGQPMAPLTFWYLPLPADAPEKKPWPADLHVRHMAIGFAQQMVQLLHAHPDTHPGNMAVLVRSHAHAQAMQQALTAVGLPSVFLSDHANVYQSPEALDLWRVLRAISMPRHTQALRGALACRLWALPLATLPQMLHDPELGDALAESCQQWLQIWQRQGVLPMLYQWLHSQGVAQRLLSQPQGDRRLTNLLQLGELLQTAAARLQGPAALLAFLAQQIQSNNDNPDAQKMRLETDAQCVQVVTFHKSKGLQYPLVFVPFLGSFQASKSHNVEDDDVADFDAEEDMRLLYVALTRAQRGMWLGVASTSQSLSGKGDAVKRSVVSDMLQRQSHEDLPERLQTLFGHHPDIAIAELPLQDTVVSPPLAKSRASQLALVPHRIAYPLWWKASFSGLTRGIDTGSAREEAQSDAWTDALAHALWDGEIASETHAEMTRTATVFADTDFWHTYPKGAQYGSLLHDLLEWQSQQGWPLAHPPETTHPLTEQAWQQLMERKTRGLNLTAQTVKALPEALRGLMTASLPIDGAPPLVLSKLSAEQRWPEMGFEFDVANLSSTQMDRWIASHVLPGQAREPLPARVLQGMLTGFIDLVFEHHGRYWVLDYKSNGLAAYDATSLNQAVLQKRYDVQYVLYLVALHRLLSVRLPNYDYDTHVGGALYLFVRGLNHAGAGVHQVKPPFALIQQLDRAFAGEPA